MSKQPAYFHFTLGPIQSFIAQARRTRDFWAGSFILSWLSAIAMEAVQKQGGQILFPACDDNVLDWLRGDKTSPKDTDMPRQASVPSRFKAKVGPGFRPEEVTESVKIAWQALAERVWVEDLKLSNDSETRRIWERQINGFWDILWVLTEDPQANEVLEQRKHLRQHSMPEEPGVKCMIMDGWQELSGAAGPGRELRDFWRQELNINTLDLREGEQLCAIAFIKRRFTHYYRTLKIAMPGGWTAHGWPLNPQGQSGFYGVPSVSYMAAVHWLKQVITEADIKLLDEFIENANALSSGYGEWHTNIRVIRESLDDRDIGQTFASLDGDLFFETSLTNPRMYPQNTETRKLLSILRKIQQQISATPSPFYAVLLMDGDSLSQLIHRLSNQEAVSNALKLFTADVPGCIEKYNGFPVYAGGDDVLAVLPLEDVFKCAIEIRKIYLQAFSAIAQGFQEKDAAVMRQASISAAVEFAHVRTPLMKVLQDGHKLLDDVAKDGRGRDALAVRVWKPGGKALEWAQPWARCSSGSELILEETARHFRDSDGEAPFSSKFFYKIRGLYELMQTTESDKQVLNRDDALLMMASEYLDSGANDGRKEKLDIAGALKIVTPLLEQCLPTIREADKLSTDWQTLERFEVDGALLVRFLASKGLEQNR
ncbi:MAG: type III-B CRISPR-associated protein Cas10/Cmr2 [Pseudomonadota bacterium]